jgi:hypothetical protein
LEILPVQNNAVFLNIPYDERFRRLYIAYIVGLAELGFRANATLSIPGGERRLDRIFALIQSCRYSVHDLSRVELDRSAPATPRFNMPFELGLAVAWEKINPKRHTWFVCESKLRRVQKSLSDLDGTDPNVHGGTPEGVMRELCNAFVRRGSSGPSVPAMMRNYQNITRQSEDIMVNAGAKSVFAARVFEDLCFSARANVEGI